MQHLLDFVDVAMVLSIVLGTGAITAVLLRFTRA